MTKRKKTHELRADMLAHRAYDPYETRWMNRAERRAAAWARRKAAHRQQASKGSET